MEYNTKIDYLCSKKMSENIIHHSGDESYYRDVFNLKRDDLMDELSKDIYLMRKVIDYIKLDTAKLSLKSIDHILSILNIDAVVNKVESL